MQRITLAFLIFSFLVSCSPKISKPAIDKFQPPSLTLQAEIEQMDSLLFDAYNTCKMTVMDSIFSENIEFYHDQGGLSTSKPDLMLALKNNICDKVTRHLKKGSIEVYPIANYGAVEMGLHAFYNKAENNSLHYSKFVHIWKKEPGGWKLTRVVSLH